MIGDITQYSETRVSADQWIEQFNKEIDDAIRESEALEEKEREEMRREEERRLRLERRSRLRKINKPLINKNPGLGAGGHSSHDRICRTSISTFRKKV